MQRETQNQTSTQSPTLGNAPRLAPVEPPYNAEVQRAFDTIMPPGVSPLNILRTVAHNPRVLSRMVNCGLLDKGSIAMAERELIILRTCALCGAQYEWGVHVAVFAAAAGLNAAQTNATCHARIDDELWDEKQKIVIALVDELHRSDTVSDALWQQLSEHYDADQLVEMVMLAGLYHAVSFVVNAFRVAPEEMGSKFPDTYDL